MQLQDGGRYHYNNYNDIIIIACLAPTLKLKKLRTWWCILAAVLAAHP